MMLITSLIRCSETPFISLFPRRLCRSMTFNLLDMAFNAVEDAVICCNQRFSALYET